MNRFKMIGLAVALAVTMSFAARGSLWHSNTVYGIVKFPWVESCLKTVDPTHVFDEYPDHMFNEANKDDICFKKLGGWWFAYVAGPSAGEDRIDCGPTSQKSSTTNYVEAKLDGKWLSFVGPDYNSCEGPEITDLEDGRSKMEGGLELKLSIGPGDPAGYQPDIASFAVNLNYADNINGKSPNPSRDLKNRKGFCVTYISDHENTLVKETGSNIGMEIGWNEDLATAGTNKEEPYDTWYALLPDGTGAAQVARFTWEGTLDINDQYTPNTIGDFVQDNWAPAPYGIDDATKKMVAVKFRLKGYEPTVVNFKLLQFGWYDECNTDPAPNRITSGAKIANAVNFNMIGKIAYMTVAKPAAVQVINLQGKVVYTQTLTPTNQRMNLNNLPTGVYMLRVPSLGYTNKIILK
ncbi:MAG: T9SS type A sorting domain-containing protein [Fibromonadales bacterium]|nr:T9SS type A sorting domain-containing protein [Fibromonadales bacterium]